MIESMNSSRAERQWFAFKTTSEGINQLYAGHKPGALESPLGWTQASIPAPFPWPCSSYTPGLSSLLGSDPYGGPSPISHPRRPSSLQVPVQTALPSKKLSTVPWCESVFGSPLFMLPNLCLVSGFVLYWSAWKMHSRLPTSQPWVIQGWVETWHPARWRSLLQDRYPWTWMYFALWGLAPRPALHIRLCLHNWCLAGSSWWPGGQHSGSSSPAQPSSCLTVKTPRTPPTRLSAGQSVVPPRQRHLASCVYT